MKPVSIRVPVERAEEARAAWLERFPGIGPPWARPPRDVVPVVIDPGRAFGTGAHATTRLCVELVATLEPRSLLESVDSVEKASLLDIGCGSGVVAIAAALLGFAPVLAVDVDPAAIEASVRNAAANGVELDTRTLDAKAARLPATSVVVANVSLDVVESLMPRLDARLVVASGYLEGDEPELGPYGRVARRTRDGWAADLLERAQ